MQSYNNLVYYDYFCPRIAQIFYNMQKVIISLLLILECTGIQAQSNLAGRIYYNPNILSGKMKELSQEVNKNMADAKAQAIKEEEQKKKRKLSASEKAEVEKKAEQAQKVIQAMEKGMKTAITMTFKDENTVVMKTEMKIDDEALKSAGIGWAKRKVIQAACAISPSEKAKYTVKCDMIILEEGKELDTMYLSNDGKTLTGKMDQDTPFKLTRTK